MVCVRSVLKNACGVGQVKPVALPCSSARDHLVLLGGAELRERRVVGLAAIGFERRQPTPIEILLVGIGAGEREIDVIEHARIRAPGLPGAPGISRSANAATVAVVVIEEGAVPRAMRMRLGRGSGCRRPPDAVDASARSLRCEAGSGSRPTAAPIRNARRPSSGLLMMAASLRFDLVLF